jgi:uncharacterized protein
MSDKTRYVLDTNVIISALLFKNSNPAKVVRAVFKLGDVLLSLDLLREISAVISRDKFSKFITIEKREEFLEKFVQDTILVEIVEEIQACRDPKDDLVLELAVSGGAEYIISGDKDLLVLNPFRNIKIVTAQEFLIMIESQ